MSNYSDHLFQPLDEATLNEVNWDNIKKKIKQGFSLNPKGLSRSEYIKHTAARAAGGIATNLLLNKLSNRGFMQDYEGGPARKAKRLATTLAGAELGERLYNKFNK